MGKQRTVSKTTNILRKLRLEREMSQMDVAVRIGVHPNVLSGMERRKGPIYPGYRAKLAECFGVQPEDLVDEHGFAREVE